MTTYTTIPNSSIDPESPIDASMMFSLRDNPIAMTEGAVGAPQYKGSAIASAAITDTNLGFQFPLKDRTVFNNLTIQKNLGQVLGHSTTQIPLFVQTYITCSTAESGYSVGDRVLIEPGSSEAVLFKNGGMTMRFEPSTVRIEMVNNLGVGSTVFGLLHKTTGIGVNATDANWKLSVAMFW